eukprot:SAG25_NODE_9737_length_360_cov_0.555556_1_plen_77_part_10
MDSKNTAKGNPKGRPAVASKDLDKDMPEDIRNASKLEQLKWRKKHAQEQHYKTPPRASVIVWCGLGCRSCSQCTRPV